MRKFKTLRIWIESIKFVKQVFQIAELLPDNEKYGLRSQITRAAVSIPSNIAEGSSRNSDKEFKRFVEIAIGSAFELETQLLIIQELELIKGFNLEKSIEELNNIQKQINSFIQKLK